jgi:chorismate dehydratase
LIGKEKSRVAAVSYLNATPLVWGLLKDRRFDARYDLTFHVPAGTAELLGTGSCDIGILSSIELPRQNLDFVEGLGICSNGPVRSIFLITKKPISEIESLAVDSSSRTSTVLCRIILWYGFKGNPKVVSMLPDIDKMLTSADAALIIGDPALHLEPAALPYTVYDLGEEWTKMTGLPMVYAVWAARKGTITPQLKADLFESYTFGRDHIEEIVKIESERRGFSEPLAREYLTEHIRYEMGPQYTEGMRLYLEYAKGLNLI